MKKLSQITVVINKTLFPALQNMLASVGIKSLHVAAGRSIMLQENKGIRKLIYSDDTITDEQSSVVSFFVSGEFEEKMLQFIISRMNLAIPGRGSAYSMSVDLLDSSSVFKVSTPTISDVTFINLQKHLMGISAIFMRGEGDGTGRVLLDTGTCVPVITFGIGTGLRDKVGLWRVTIPAEKEVINGMCEASEADMLMNMMIDSGNLDMPGKGFIYLYPINQGLLNTKFYIGVPAHAASLEQIIYSIDELKGDTSWRRREGREIKTQSSRKFLTDLVDINLYCKEGKADDLVKASMAAGAAGATITRLKMVTHESLPDVEKQSVFPALELCNMSVGPKLVEPIMTALREAGAFEKEQQGMVVSYPVTKACTYLGK